MSFLLGVLTACLGFLVLEFWWYGPVQLWPRKSAGGDDVGGYPAGSRTAADLAPPEPWVAPAGNVRVPAPNTSRVEPAAQNNRNRLDAVLLAPHPDDVEAEESLADSPDAYRSEPEPEPEPEPGPEPAVTAASLTPPAARGRKRCPYPGCDKQLNASQWSRHDHIQRMTEVADARR